MGKSPKTEEEVVLDEEEKEILAAFARGELQRVPDFKKQKKTLEKAAQNTIKRLKKDKQLNIRISQVDLDLLKQRAFEEGMPYQTLLSSILHKYLIGRLVDSK